MFWLEAAHGHRNGGQTQKTPFGRRCHRAGIKHIIPHIRPIIGPGDNDIRLSFKNASNGQMNAIRWGTVHLIKVFSH